MVLQLVHGIALLPPSPAAPHLSQSPHSTEAPPTPKPAPRLSESEDHRNERKENRSSSIFGPRRQDPRQSISELPEPKVMLSTALVPYLCSPGCSAAPRAPGPACSTSPQPRWDLSGGWWQPLLQGGQELEEHKAGDPGLQGLPSSLAPEVLSLPSVSQDEKWRLSCNISESSLSSDGKQPPPSRAAAGAQPRAAGTTCQATFLSVPTAPQAGLCPPTPPPA